MEQPIIIGISATLFFLIVNFAIWFMGHKKLAALKEKNAVLTEENLTLQQSLSLSEKNSAITADLTEEIKQYKVTEEKLREEITKITTSLMAEVKKSAAMQEISSKLAKSEMLVEGLQSTTNKDKATIDHLTKQITEKEIITKDNNSILQQLKEVFA